jgi:DNA topoisomerase-1
MANMAIERGYAQLISHSYQMLPLGDDVVKFLDKYFNFIMDKEFTKFFENQLDLIADGKLDWKDPIMKFQPILSKSIKKAEKADDKTYFVNRKCPECGSDLVYRYAKDNGIRFIGCSNYPKCKYNEFPNAMQPKKTGLKCPECGSDLVIKMSKRKRKFIGCSNYPTCNFIMKTNSKIIKTIETAINENKIPDVKVEKAIFEKKTTKAEGKEKNK